MDEGTWRRIRVIPFESKFLADDNPELLLGRPNIFPRDPKLDEKLRLWREPFLALLVHIYETEYIPSGLNPIPATVSQASNKYKDNYDVYARFKGERIREPVSVEEQMEFRENPFDSKKLGAILRQWKKDNHISNLTPEMIIARMEAHYGKPEGGRFWPAIRIFATDEDVAEWDSQHSVKT